MRGEGDRRPAARGRTQGSAGRPARVVAALLAVLAILLAAPAAAQVADPGGPERILSYISAIAVESNGDIEVEETLTVVARGDQIRHGIYKDFNLVHASGYGRSRTSLDILSVMLDGEPVDYHTGSITDGRRLYIGDADSFVSDGTHIYQVTYRLGNEIAFYPDYDEIYLNVTGNGWTLPIEMARATVSPPPGAPVKSVDAYTGAYGDKGGAVRTTRNAEGDPVFTTTAPLQPGEGLTVAVAWPKGFVPEPTGLEQAMDAMMPALVAGAGFVVALLYYLWAWRRVGRDPVPGPVIPVYRPELPPYAMRFIERVGYDPVCLAAAVIDLAVKGYIRIDERDRKDASLTRQATGRRPPSAGEEVVLKHLFPGPEEGAFTDFGEHSVRVAETSRKFASFLKGRFLRDYIAQNRGWFAVGAIITLASWIGAGFTVSDPGTVAGEAVGAALATILVLGIGTSAVSQWRDMLRGRWIALPGVLVWTVFVIFGTVGWLVTALSLMVDLGLAAALVLIAGTGLNVLFFHLLKRPTAAGRKALDEIAGTRLYLTVAEADRLKFHNPPDRTPAHFEEMLPYAIALGVETAWTDQFKAALAASAAAGIAATLPQPDWYSGSHWNEGGWSNLGGGLTNSVTSSVQKGMQAIAAAKAKSTGVGASFGGGFSGGGGGSSGGGGW
ncbi:Predicted membrane protein [Pseudoxanthobacter soli DSM 19599]|uniref:Predicted membrane protein n=1 Tax=Pseudoxanthobacter soli DSM 19599 TaxID=1123029 RepID=A0A1M7ZKA9_9HYPH|nr:DUF2207 domain-containing protein [Pseudoxanthobacter soli]SHO65311.1 Predicted membrane protein [Pseudoxanthobacter soli DSM 19599]